MDRTMIHDDRFIHIPNQRDNFVDLEADRLNATKGYEKYTGQEEQPVSQTQDYEQQSVQESQPASDIQTRDSEQFFPDNYVDFDDENIDDKSNKDSKDFFPDSYVDFDSDEMKKESEEISWWDTAKEWGVQAALGISKAFTWPLDILKLAVIGEAYSGMDEFKRAYERNGEVFDESAYIRGVKEQAEFVPTQELMEGMISKNLGIETKPKTKSGKVINKFFYLKTMAARPLLRGNRVAGDLPSIMGRSAGAGAVGVGTAEGLKAAGANETASEIIGDVVSGAVPHVGSVVRNINDRARILRDIADRHGLPFSEFMMRMYLPKGPKISPARRLALETELGMSSEEAIRRVIEGQIPLSQLRRRGLSLDVLENDVYAYLRDLVRRNNYTANIDVVINDIEREIMRIQNRAPSQSVEEAAKIRILQQERFRLINSRPSVEQLITQTENYNSNVKDIYRLPEAQGVEEGYRQAYGFLNSSIHDLIERTAGPEVAAASVSARTMFGQNAQLIRTDNLINKCFAYGEYNPTLLRSVLTSQEGALVARDLGEQAIREIRDIANFGARAQQATTQFANSAARSIDLRLWGPLAGFALSYVPHGGYAAVGATVAPMFNYVRGWMLTNPAARTVYRMMIMDAANGIFKNMVAYGVKLENEVIKEFGSVDAFFEAGIDQLYMYDPKEEEKKSKKSKN